MRKAWIKTTLYILSQGSIWPGLKLVLVWKSGSTVSNQFAWNSMKATMQNICTMKRMQIELYYIHNAATFFCLNSKCYVYLLSHNCFNNNVKIWNPLFHTKPIFHRLKHFLQIAFKPGSTSYVCNFRKSVGVTKLKIHTGTLNHC